MLTIYRVQIIHKQSGDIVDSKKSTEEDVVIRFADEYWSDRKIYSVEYTFATIEIDNNDFK